MALLQSGRDVRTQRIRNRGARGEPQTLVEARAESAAAESLGGEVGAIDARAIAIAADDVEEQLA